MNRLQPVHAELPVELAPHGEVRLAVGQVVSGGKGVAAVEANADPLRPSHLRDDRRQVVELPAEVRPLAGRDLQADLRFDPRPQLVHEVDRPGDIGQALLFAGSGVRAGMDDDVRNA